MNEKTFDYTIVDGVLVWIRSDITDFTVPDGVVEVADGAIHDRIRRIVFPDSVKRFYIPKFNSIREIVLPRVLHQYDGEYCDTPNYLDKCIKISFGLDNLRWLKTITPPVEFYTPYFCERPHDEYYVIEKNKPQTGIKASKVILKYTSLEELLGYGYEYVGSLFYSHGSTKQLECVGPPLNNKERRQVKRYFKKYISGLDIIFTKTIEVSKEPSIKNQDAELQALLDKIETLCIKLPVNSRKIIMDKVHELLMNYDKKLEEYRPKYHKDPEIKLDLGSAMLSKTQLITALRSIIFSLSSEEVLVNSLSEIDGCRKLITSEIDKMVLDNSLEANVRNIIYYANMLDERRKKAILDKLNKHFSVAEKGITSRLSSLKVSNEIILENPVDYKANLEMAVFKLLDETKLLADKVAPYKRLQDSLNSSSTHIDPKNSTIAMDIVKLRWILSKLLNDKYKDDLEKRVNDLFKKYDDKISKLLSDDELLNKDDYEKLELAFREELNPILEDIKKYLFLDSYRRMTANNDNILIQLKHAIDFIRAKKNQLNVSNEEKIKIDEAIHSEVIASFVADLYNQIVSSKEISDEVRQEILDDLYAKLWEIYSPLIDKEIDSIKEYNEALQTVLSEIAKIQIGILEYINNTRQ